MKREKFSISGMTCAACSAGIERTLQKRAGVTFVSVSLMGESMQIEYDEKLTTKEDIFAVVRSLGYGISEEKPIKKNTEDKILRLRFIISAVLLVALMYFSMGEMVGLPQPTRVVNYALQWALSTAIIVVNFKFFTVGVRALLKGVPNMDTLVSLGASVSYIYSIVLVILHLVGADDGEMPMLYFESAGMILALVTLGKWLESLSKKRTGNEIEKLVRLAPATATLVEQNGIQKIVSVSSLRAGDVVLVRQGDYVPVDGVVIKGFAAVDKSAVTGESLPVEVQAGDRVTSANIVKSGAIEVLAERVGEQTVLSGIIKMVQEAGASKAPLQKIADRVAGIFVPAVTVIAVLTFIIWLCVTQDVSAAMNFAVSVLVISCPCSLGLATPVAVMAATGRGAGMGILYKDAEALQKAAQINCVMLDKTATLTEGRPQVTDFLCFGDEKEVKRIASGIERLSGHPLASCVGEFCGEAYQVSTYRYIMGQGAVAEFNGKTYRIGNAKLCEGVKGLSSGERFLQEGKTVIYFTEEDTLLAVFAIADVLKQTSRRTVACLKKRGIRVVMLTGDNDYAADAAASEVGIDEYYADVLPEDKLNYVAALQETGATVAMVGDGINDSPALKQADVGVAVGTGTDVAIDSADVVLASGDLSALDNMLALSKKAVVTVKQNLFWAFFYNCIAIPVAAGAFAWAGLTLNPMIAAACMSLSSLFVVGNALRLTVFRKNKKKAENKNSEEIKMKKVLHVEGMMCQHCVARVTKALEEVAGAGNVTVHLKKKTATVCAENLDERKLADAVTAAGYTVKKID